MRGGKHEALYSNVLWYWLKSQHQSLGPSHLTKSQNLPMVYVRCDVSQSKIVTGLNMHEEQRLWLVVCSVVNET